MSDRPSYILFITDQQRYDHLGCNGHPVLQTPNIDAMAAQGVNYDRFYVASPVCMPNRASLMTCRMPSSHGVRSLGVPLTHDNVTFVDLMRAAGYDTALIGKSHLQTVTDWPVQIEPPAYRDGFCAPPEELAVAIKSDLAGRPINTKSSSFTKKMIRKCPLPFYGFRRLCLCHCDTGSIRVAATSSYQKQHAPDVLPLKSRDVQFPHDYICPQAIRTKVPEEHYSTRFIADRTVEFLKSREGNEKPFFLMVSFPDPHHPFTPPGKYWDMYKPEDMPVPHAYTANDWDPPDYVKIAERDRKNDPSLGQASGHTVAVSQREAQEARALTCGMIAMVDDAVGQIQAGSARGGRC